MKTVQPFTLLARIRTSVVAATKELGEFGNVQGGSADITNIEQVAELLGKLSKEFAKIDYLVNASGIFGPKPFLDCTLDDYNNYLNLNRGFYFITQNIAKGMGVEWRWLHRECWFYVGQASH